MWGEEDNGVNDTWIDESWVQLLFLFFFFSWFFCTNEIRDGDKINLTSTKKITIQSCNYGFNFNLISGQCRLKMGQSVQADPLYKTRIAWPCNFSGNTSCSADPFKSGDDHCLLCSTIHGGGDKKRSRYYLLIVTVKSRSSM